jgi:hypothetical protein
MAWRINKTRVRWVGGKLTKAEQDHLNEFVNAIGSGSHPKTAADGWDSNYKMLTDVQGQIRLSEGRRATFEVDEDNQVVYLRDVGGHT